MRKLSLLACTLLVAAAPAAAFADTVSGPYVSLGAGYNLLQDEFLRTDTAVSGIPSGKSVDPITGTTGSNTRFKWGDGFNGQGAIGYGLGNGLRIELEGDTTRTKSMNAPARRSPAPRPAIPVRTAPWAMSITIST